MPNRRNALLALVSSVFAPLLRATEGQPRPGPWPLPVSGGWLAANEGDRWNWWQLGFNIRGGHSGLAMIEACISAYSQTVAQCPGDHWRKLANGGRERVTNSALSRILRRPNEYQSISDFMLNSTRSLYLHGNAYALALRNARYEIASLHLMDPTMSTPCVTQYGEVFYRLGGNSVIDQRRRFLEDFEHPQLLVPQRDVLHLRLHADRQHPIPLIGETPLVAAYGDIETLEKIKNQQDNFYDNQARPSAVLSTDLNLDKDQVAQLRDRWNEQAKGLHAGGVPILTHGLKVQPWAQLQGRDLQIVETRKLTNDQIALVFRVPLAILGLERASGTSTEQLYASWLSGALGFCLNHIEEAWGNLFDLDGQPDEYVEFDTEALLRSARKDRIEMLVRGVQGGIFSPNEAREKEDLPAVPYGESPRVQQQVVPLSAAAAIAPVVGGPAPAAPAAPGPGAAPPAPPAAGVSLPKEQPQLLLITNQNEKQKELLLPLEYQHAVRSELVRSLRRSAQSQYRRLNF